MSHRSSSPYKGALVSTKIDTWRCPYIFWGISRWRNTRLETAQAQGKLTFFCHSLLYTGGCASAPLWLVYARGKSVRPITNMITWQDQLAQYMKRCPYLMLLPTLAYGQIAKYTCQNESQVPTQSLSPQEQEHRLHHVSISVVGSRIFISCET